jgi:hypothetical protein
VPAGGVPVKWLAVSEMKPFTWYLGSGRGSDVGYWDGKHFFIFRQKFDSADWTTCDHWDDGGPFLPMQEIVSPWAGAVRSGHATTEELEKK